MEKQKLAHIVRHYCKQLEKYSKKLRKGLDEEAIHDFRVSVKKLRSFLRLMRLKAKEPDELKYPKSFKKMYGTFGKVRDRQLCIARIKKTDKHFRGARLKELKQQIKELEDEKDYFPGRRDIEKMEKNMIEHLPLAPSTLVRDFVQQKLMTIRGTIAAGKYGDTEIHGIRKNLKDIYYILAIYHDDLKLKFPFRFWTDEEKKKVEDLTLRLGSFNDTVTALSFLPVAEIQKAGNTEKDHLLSIRRHWLAEKRKLKKEILVALTGLRLSTASIPELSPSSR